MESDLQITSIKQRIAQLTREHGCSVYQCAFKILGDRHQAEDIAQEVFLKLFNRSLDELDSIRNWRAYLKTMATSASCDYLRKSFHQRELSDQVVTLPLTQSQQHQLSAPEQNVASQQQLHQLRQALTTLKPQEAEVFVLRTIEELSYQEIAEQMVINQSHVGALLHRAKQKLIDHFSQFNSEEPAHASN